MKGDLWLFNPHCELSILKEQQHYTPPKMIKKVQNDLSVLLMWLASENDTILTANNQVNSSWLSTMQSVVGIYFKLESPQGIKEKKIKFSGIKSWGESPSLVSDLHFMNVRYLQSLIWDENHKRLFHREFGYELLGYVVDNELDEVIAVDQLGKFINTPDAIYQEIIDLFTSNPYGVILKLPFSSSGRGLLVLKRNDITPSVKSWVESAINQQGSVLVEPLFEKVFDFSLLFKKYNNEVEFLGGSSFLTGMTGQYYGASLNSFQNEFSVKEWDTLQKVIELIKTKLKTENTLSGYFGIDAMMIQGSNGERIIHPCVEINPRYTMGHITLNIEKAVLENRKAEWRIVTKHEIKDFIAFQQEMEEKYPLILNNRKVQSGFLPLVDVNLVQNYFAYLLVEDEEI